MALRQELQDEVSEILREQWTERKGQIVPTPENISLGNDAVKLDAAVLYADMAESTQLVDDEIPGFAAEVYKSYLTCAARIVKDEEGTITAYDGDRIMAVFIGATKNTTAVRCALKINYAVRNIINPALSKQYFHRSYKVRHHIGIDTSSLFVSRIGVRNDNDLVWVGRAANYAAKLMLYPRIRHNFSNRRGVQYDVESSEVQRQRSEPMWKERRGCLRAMRRVTYRVFGCRSARCSLLQRDESVRQ